MKFNGKEFPIANSDFGILAQKKKKIAMRINEIDAFHFRQRQTKIAILAKVVNIFVIFIYDIVSSFLLSFFYTCRFLGYHILLVS